MVIQKTILIPGQGVRPSERFPGLIHHAVLYLLAAEHLMYDVD
jgi:hypothetical protein